jgi:hypothetical protein
MKLCYASTVFQNLIFERKTLFSLTLIDEPTYSVENLKLYIEMAHGKQASDKLFNEISWLIVHSLKEHSQHHSFQSVDRIWSLRIYINTGSGKPFSCAIVL